MIDIDEIPVYVLNLPKRKDRAQHMQKLLTEVGLKHQFVIPYEASENLIAKLRSDKIISPNNTSTNKYKASHTLTYIDIIKNSESDYILIVEDDLVSDIKPSEIKAQMQGVIDATPGNFDVIFFEYCHETCSLASSTSRRLSNPLCLGACLWKRSSALQLVNSFYNEMSHIDYWIQKRIISGELLAYGPQPPLFYQSSAFGTDLPMAIPYFLRRIIFGESQRHCVQDEKKRIMNIGLMFLAGLGVIVYANRKREAKAAVKELPPSEMQ